MPDPIDVARLREANASMRTALRALRLEVDAAVMDDVDRIWTSLQVPALLDAYEEREGLRAEAQAYLADDDATIQEHLDALRASEGFVREERDSLRSKLAAAEANYEACRQAGRAARAAADVLGAKLAEAEEALEKMNKPGLGSSMMGMARIANDALAKIRGDA